MLFLSDISFTFCKALIFFSSVWTFGHECHIAKALINYSISPSIHVHVLLFINHPAKQHKHELYCHFIWLTCDGSHLQNITNLLSHTLWGEVSLIYSVKYNIEQKSN